MRLEEMMNKQKELQERLGYDIDNMRLSDKTSFVKEFSIHATQEMHEMLYEMPFFKPWQEYDSTNLIKAKEEFIDMWHFILNIALGLGFTAEEIYEEYCKKNIINHKRQDNGYVKK